VSETPKGPRRRNQQHRLRRMREEGLTAQVEKGRSARSDSVVDCGWGRLIFGNTFDEPGAIAEALRGEGDEQRDIALYVKDPQVLLSLAPQDLFLDPSLTYRLNLATYRPASERRSAFFVRQLTSRRDAEAINVILSAHGMVQISPDYFWTRRDPRSVTALVAEDAQTGEVLGFVMGVDHGRAFADPAKGSSLWSLAVAPQAPHSGVGESLTRRLAEIFMARGVAYMDLSVLHDNKRAIALYEKIGFRQVTIFAVKRKNPINEKLFTGEAPGGAALNPYARIIVDEARRRGIFVEIVDAEGGFFRLKHGGRSVVCRESLSEFTTAVAMSICDDKRTTRRIVEAAGVRVPAHLEESTPESRADFLDAHDSVVVKPARGEQGRGVSVGLKTPEDVEVAFACAREMCDDIVVEECFEGEDLRIIVIDYKVVAAALRRPARVIGDGVSDMRKLIKAQSRRRSSATGGESAIPLDAETERCIAEAGYTMDQAPADGEEVVVRRTANLHTGGTIHDVTERTHPALIEAALRTARAIEIPVVGVDLMVKSPLGPEYVFIEANERPGLANHEPQPTAERFVDFLFPLSIPQSARKLRREASL